jgi:hypothetical protein
MHGATIRIKKIKNILTLVYVGIYVVCVCVCVCVCIES